ncbi:hypothetical protein BH11PLA2_BH11PLA2_23980 [soil metagenome]
MKTGTPGRVRTALLLTALLPLIITGILVLTPLGADALIPLLVAGGTATVFVAAGIIFATRRFQSC